MPRPPSGAAWGYEVQEQKVGGGRLNSSIAHRGLRVSQTAEKKQGMELSVKCTKPKKTITSPAFRTTEEKNFWRKRYSRKSLNVPE